MDQKIRMNLFTSDHRIKEKKEFQQLFEKSFRVYGSFFVFRIMLSETQFSKLGIMVSKKFGNAVYRNLIKRMVREEFRKSNFSKPVYFLISQYRRIDDMAKSCEELKNLFFLFSDTYLLFQYIHNHEDSFLKNIQKTEKMSFLSKNLFHFILWYKRKISLYFSASCRMKPTCSIYALECLRVYPQHHALLLILKRICNCRPGGKKGFDFVPKIETYIKKSRLKSQE